MGDAQLFRFSVNPDDRFLREMGAYPREAARLLKMNGKVLAFRDIGMPSALTYNKRLFREAARMFPDAGLVDEHGEPVPPETWLAFYRTAKVLTEYGRCAARERGLAKPICHGLVIQGRRAYDLMRGIRPLANRAGTNGFNFRGGKWLKDKPGEAFAEWCDRRVGCFEYEHPGLLAAWNEFRVPLLCTLTRPHMQPLAVAVYQFQRGHPGKWHQINAAASVMIVPVILLFLLVQKHVVKAVAVGAVKG